MLETTTLQQGHGWIFPKPHIRQHREDDFSSKPTNNARSRQETKIPSLRELDESLRELHISHLPLSLSENASKILGENGRRRFEEFREYPNDWAGGRGRTLSRYSLTMLEVFLERMPQLSQFEPSLFFTYQGNLQIGFEDNNGAAIEIEFFPSKIDYYLESFNEEETIGLERIDELVEKIRLSIV